MNIYVAQSKFGRGIFATRSIAAGEFILKYDGRIISSEMAHCDESGYPLQISEHNYIELDPPGMFTNHSCEPNAGILHDCHLVGFRRKSKCATPDAMAAAHLPLPRLPKTKLSRCKVVTSSHLASFVHCPLFYKITIIKLAMSL